MYSYAVQLENCIRLKALSALLTVLDGLFATLFKVRFTYIFPGLNLSSRIEIVFLFISRNEFAGTYKSSSKEMVTPLLNMQSILMKKNYNVKLCFIHSI